MAPRQVPYQLPWRDAHPFFLLSPLMALLSRAWSRLMGPGPPKPWLARAIQSAGQGEAGLQGEAETALATSSAPWGRHPPGVAEGSGAAVEAGESSWKACPALKANSSLLEDWEHSDDNDEEYRGEEATSSPTEQGSEYIHSQLAPLSPSLLKSLRDPPREEESEEGGVAEDKAIMFSFPPSHWESGPGMEEEEDGEAVGAGVLHLERRQREEKLSPTPSEWPSIHLERSRHPPGLFLGCLPDCKGGSSLQKPPPGIWTLRRPKRPQRCASLRRSPSTSWLCGLDPPRLPGVAPGSSSPGIAAALLAELRRPRKCWAPASPLQPGPRPGRASGTLPLLWLPHLPLPRSCPHPLSRPYP